MAAIIIIIIIIINLSSHINDYFKPDPMLSKIFRGSFSNSFVELMCF